jgi:hypothetical protein
MDIPGAIQQAVDTVYQHAFPFATTLAGVGVVTMAVIQTLKDMLPLRRWFQAAWISRWLERRAAKAGSGVSAARAEADLVRLATGGDRNALYDLAIEQVAAQMNAAAPIVLDYPWDHADLLHCLAADANAEDLDHLLAWRPPLGAPRPQVSPEERAALVDARNRVTHQVQRSLDGLQISAGFQWKFYLQVASIALSAVLVWIGLILFAQGSIEVFVRHLPLYVLTAVLGGFLAPVARDLVAALQQLRR